MPGQLLEIDGPDIRLQTSVCQPAGDGALRFALHAVQAGDADEPLKRLHQRVEVERVQGALLRCAQRARRPASAAHAAASLTRSRATPAG